jgi:endonuclease G
VWGDDVTARTANQDTFTFTNAAPQVDDFNQGKELWVGLEDHVLNHADLHDARLSVFTGPVFADDDPPYRGIQIPRKFWKVAAWTMDGQLASAGFLVDQSPLLDRVDLEKAIRERRLTGEPPPLGPFRTFQVPVHELAKLTGLSLAPLVLADRLTSRQRSLGEEPRAVRLERAEEIRL